MTPEERTPNLFDYVAGAILANGISAMWDFIVNLQPTLVVISLPIYCIAGGLATYLVCKRTTKQHLIVGLKTLLMAWIFGMVLMFNVTTGIDTGTATLLLICYASGGIVASYIALKQQLRAKPKPAPINQEEP